LEDLRRALERVTAPEVLQHVLAIPGSDR